MPRKKEPKSVFLGAGVPPPSRSYGAQPMMGYGGGIHHHHHYHLGSMPMEGEGFLDDAKNFFTQTIPSTAKSVGKDIASNLIHQGIPAATGALGALAGETVAPELGVLSGAAGGYAGQQLGNAAADAIGKATGYGLKLKKGSAEAKEWGRRMKALRDAKKR